VLKPGKTSTKAALYCGREDKERLPWGRKMVVFVEDRTASKTPLRVGGVGKEKHIHNPKEIRREKSCTTREPPNKAVNTEKAKREKGPCSTRNRDSQMS